MPFTVADMTVTCQLVCVTPENLINELNRPETPRIHLRRCVLGASPEVSLVMTVSKTELCVPF